MPATKNINFMLSCILSAYLSVSVFLCLCLSLTLFVHLSSPSLLPSPKLADRIAIIICNYHATWDMHSRVSPHQRYWQTVFRKFNKCVTFPISHLFVWRGQGCSELWREKTNQMIQPPAPRHTNIGAYGASHIQASC